MNNGAKNLDEQNLSHLRKRTLIRIPLIPFAIAMMLGILTSRYIPLPIGGWITLGAVSFVVAIATLRWEHLRILTCIALGVCVFALGAGRFCVSYYSVGEDSIASSVPQDQRILATVRGRVESFPQRVSPDVEYGYRGNEKILFLLRATEVKTAAGWSPVSGLMRVSVYEPYKTFEPGDIVELVGSMGRFRSKANPGGYDARAAARMSGTWAWFRVKTSSACTVISRRSGFDGWLWRMRAGVQQRLTESGDIESGQLLSALILGDRHRVLGKLNRVMVKAGIAHFLSISGLHLGVFLGFVYAVCRLLWASRRTSAFVMLLVLAAYLMIAETRPPLLRSAIMAALLGLSVILGRKNSSLNALGAAAIILLLIDPRQLLTPGFQLSFAIVTGLILMHYRMRELLFGWWFNRRGLTVYRREQRLKRWFVFRFTDVVINAVTVSVTAYLVALPLVGHYFGVFTPLAAIFGVVFFPLVVAVLVPGYLAMATVWLTPNLSAGIGKLAAVMADFLASCAMVLEAIPFLSIRLRPVGIAWVLLYYVVLVAILTARKNRWRRVAAAGLFAVLVAATVFTQLPHKPDGADMEFHLLSVGAGQCGVLQTPAGQTYIIDAGSMRGNDVYRCIIEPFFYAKRLPAPDGLFVSHANTDHFNSLPDLIREGNVELLYSSSYFIRENKTDDITRRGAPQGFVKLLAHHGVDIRSLKAGDRLELGGGVTVDVLYPTAGKAIPTNETSLVLKVGFEGKTILLPGDIEKIGQSELLKNPTQLKCDVLVLPHHGGWSKTLPEFVAAADPEIILVSNSRDPSKQRRGSKQRIEFYESLGQSKKWRYYCTGKQGWLGLKIGKWGIEVETKRAKTGTGD